MKLSKFIEDNPNCKDFLSQDEVDALLKGVTGITDDSDAISEDVWVAAMAEPVEPIAGLYEGLKDDPALIRDDQFLQGFIEGYNTAKRKFNK